MDRPFLILRRDLSIQDRVDRLADSRGFEKRARVETDDAGRVVHGVEVVVLGFVIDRMCTPERQVLVAGEINRLPFLQSLGMRADEDADVLQARVLARAQRRHPPLDEHGLVRGATEERRAEVEHVGTTALQTDARAEVFTCPGRLAPEPLVVTLGAGHGDERRRHTVHLDGLALLRLIPHENAIRQLSNQ